MPASIRKAKQLQTQLFPAYVKLLTEVEEDEQTWAETNDENNVGNTDPFNTGVNAINTLSVNLGEKTIMPLAQGMVTQLIKSENWKEKQAGFMLLGLISEACKEKMK